MIAAVMRMWEQTTIEEALGDDAAAVLPEAIRLVLLRVRIPRWQRDMLVALARKHGTTVDEVVTRELEDVACAHAEELEGMVPGMRIGMGGRSARRKGSNRDGRLAAGGPAGQRPALRFCTAGVCFWISGV